MIKTNNEYSIGMVLSTTRNPEVFKDLAEGIIDWHNVHNTNPRLNSVLTYSGSGGWGCAQTVRDSEWNRPENIIIGFIPLNLNSDVEKDLETIKTWVETINENTIRVLSIGRPIESVVIDNIHRKVGLPGIISPSCILVPIIQKIPENTKENPWPAYMNLAMFSMVRYIYRRHYAHLASRTIELMATHGPSFLHAMYVATVTSSLDYISDTFLIHYKSQTARIPVRTFAEVVANFPLNSGIQAGFSKESTSNSPQLSAAITAFVRSVSAAGYQTNSPLSVDGFYGSLESIYGFTSNDIKYRLRTALNKKNVSEIIKILKNEETPDRDPGKHEQ